MKKNRAFLKPYIRRAKQKDFKAKKATSFYTAIDMRIYMNKPKCYVLVQRGTHQVIAVRKTKDELKQLVPSIKGRGINKRFNKWKNKMKHYAQGN